MKIYFASKVHIGPRETNDDRALVNGNIVNMSSCSGVADTPLVAVVCDGCGGYAGGGIAAQTVLEVLNKEDPSALNDENYLTAVFEKCEEAVERKQSEMPQFSEMCTTVAGCVFGDENIVIFHSGDSRVYRYDGWDVAKLTVDHSAVQELIQSGNITEKEAAQRIDRSIITRCIGVDCSPPDIQKTKSPLFSDDRFILCSDGLWESVTENEMADILDSGLTLAEMADALVELAISNGTSDNVSVCICALAESGFEKKETTPFIF